ncbi:MAG: carboxypeptidase regulatory-like domain-containing protein, partial [Bacteroidia bacterium]
MKKIYLFITAFVFLGFSLSAQNNGGSIKITLVEKKNPKESIPFANVVVYNGSLQVAVGTTDIDGNVMIKPLNAGKYNVKAVYIGYQTQQVNDVVVNNDKTSYITIPMALANEGGKTLEDVIITEYAVPLIDPDTKSGGTIDHETFQAMADKSVESVISTQAGVILTDNGSKTQIQVRGSRAGNTNVYIDGERAIGTTNMPQGAVEQMSVMLGGLPAQYGDVTGGAVSITTRGTQPKWFGGVELISSQLTDPYGYNFGGFSLGGPIASKKDSSNNKQPIIGFFMAGQGVYQKDPRPWAGGIPQVNSTKLSQLEQNPIQYNPANGAYYTASSFLTQSDLTNSKVRPNVSNKQISLAPKIDFQITPNLKITLGGNIDYNNYHTFVQEYALLNSQHNPQVIEQTYRGYLRLTQRFGAQTSTETEKTQSVVKRAFFTFQAGYQKYKYVQQDEQFKNDFFSYGFVGKFTELRKPLYGDTSTYIQKIPGLKSHVNPSKDSVIVHHGAYGLQGYQDTLIGFVAGTKNPLAANYTSNVINDIGAGNISNYPQILNAQGLMNGTVPANVQGLYYNTGRTTGAYSVRDNTIFRITSNFSADIGKNHSVMIGIEYDQRNERGYDVNARSLYNVARQLANPSGISYVDSLGHSTGTYYTQAQYAAATNPDNINGKPYGAITTAETGGAPVSSTANVFIRDGIYDPTSHSVFSRNFYDQVMGIHSGQSTQYINIDQYDPSVFNLKMFSADELLNNGNQLVSAWGYDYSGNRLAGSGKVAFSDFLNKFTTDKFGDKNYDRLSGAFTPVYMAGYIQDKFDYKD